MRSPGQRHLRQLISISLAIAVLCSLAACGVADKTSSSEATGQASAGGTLQKCRDNPSQCSFGALGDSSVAEYADFNRPGYNWVQQLVALRQLNFGEYQGEAVDDPPRNGGYSQNWAQAGATFVSQAEQKLLEKYGVDFDKQCGGGKCEGFLGLVQSIVPFDKQVTGLADQVAKGEVQVVFMSVGSFDVGIHGEMNAGNTPTDELETLVLSGLKDAVDTLLASFRVAEADPIIVVAKVIVLPPLRHYPTVTSMVERINGQLEVAMRERGIPVIDYHGFLNDPDRRDSSGKIRVGGYLIPLYSTASFSDLVPPGPGALSPCREAGPDWFDRITESTTLCPTSNYMQRFLTDDGEHETTIIQGLVANEFLGALRDSYGVDIQPLTDQEILQQAGLE
jgi:hypothetical protein